MNQRVRDREGWQCEEKRMREGEKENERERDRERDTKKDTGRETYRERMRTTRIELEKENEESESHNIVCHSVHGAG